MPNHCRSGDEDRRLERVVHLTGHSPGDGGEQALARIGGVGARVEQYEAPGAVGVLGLAAPLTGLPNSAACWSPAIPATGTSPPKSEVMP
jgi:hypothetical protein